MRPALNGSSALEHFECDINMQRTISIYPGLPCVILRGEIEGGVKLAITGNQTQAPGFESYTSIYPTSEYQTAEEVGHC